MSVEYRRATAADNAAILTFMEQHAMQTSLSIRFDRSPDFFALLNAHSKTHETWLMLRGGRIVALGSLVIRPGYVDGAVEPVVYLSDLRVTPNREIAGQWRSRFSERMQQFNADTGARYAFCAIIRDNRLAQNSIVLQRSFGFRHLRGYSTINLLARKRRRRPHKFAITRATSADIDSLSELLNRVSASQVFGVAFDRAELERRISDWPGLELSNFLLAHDAAGELLGAIAPWDYSALKRVVIDSMPTTVNWTRRLFNLLAPIHKRARIDAPPGAVIPDVAISHVALPERRADMFGALLDVALHDSIRERRTATVSLCLYDDDPLWPAIGDYWQHSVPMDLYSFRIDEEAPELNVPANCVPGFEYYLV